MTERANPLTKKVGGWPLWTPLNFSRFRQEDAWGDWFKMMDQGGIWVSSVNYWLVMAKQGWQITPKSTVISLYIAIPTSFFLLQITFNSRPPTFGSPQLLVIPSLPSITFSATPHSYILSPTTHDPYSLTWVALFYLNNIESALIHFLPNINFEVSNL